MAGTTAHEHARACADPVAHAVLGLGGDRGKSCLSHRTEMKGKGIAVMPRQRRT